MGQTTVSTLDALLDKMEEGIIDATVCPDDNPELMILGKPEEKEVFGQSLTANFQMKTMEPGAIALMTEASTEFPSPQAEAGFRGSLAICKMGITFGWTAEALLAAAGGREKLKQTVNDGIEGGMKRFKQQQVAFWYGRGDGVVFRGTGTQTSGVAYLNAEPLVPILCVEGDFLTAFRATTPGNQRSMASTDATSASFLGNGAHTCRVSQIDYENSKVYFDGTVRMTDNAVACIRGTSSGNKTYPLGLQAHLEDVNDASFKWDADDSATYDKVDTYAGQARATAAYRKLNALLYNVNGAISISALRTGSGLATSQGVKPNQMMVVMHHKMYKRLQDLFSGVMDMNQSSEVQFPGGKMKMPVMTGAGLFQMPVIVTYRIPDGVIAILSRDKNDWTHYKGTGPATGWRMNGGSRVIMKPGNTEFTDQYRSYYTVYWNNICKRPFRQVLLYGITTS